MTLGYVIAMVAVACAGCAPSVMIGPPPPQVRAQMYSVVLEVSASGRPTWISDDAVKLRAGERSVYGAGKGAAIGAIPLVGCHPGFAELWILTCPVGIVVSAGTVVVGGVSGGIYGAATTRTQGELDSAVGNLDKSVRETRLEDLLGSRVVAEIRKKTSVSVFKLGTHEALVDRGIHYTSSEIGLVLDIDEFNLHRKGKLSPDLRLDFLVSARLYGSVKGPPLYWRQWGLRTDLGNFFKLTDAGATELRSKLNAEIGKMAEAIVDDLFVTREAKPLESIEESRGRVVTLGQY